MIKKNLITPKIVAIVVISSFITSSLPYQTYAVFKPGEGDSAQVPGATATNSPEPSTSGPVNDDKNPAESRENKNISNIPVSENDAAIKETVTAQKSIFDWTPYLMLVCMLGIAVIVAIFSYLRLNKSKLNKKKKHLRIR